MVGTGALAPQLIAAHAAVRPICNVLVWGRSPEKAQRLAKRMTRGDFRIEATDDLEAAARGAPIISCATLSQEPLHRGEWMKPGQHLELVGVFRTDMREYHVAAMRTPPGMSETRHGEEDQNRTSA